MLKQRPLAQGQWCEIAKHFVRSRTSTQVASHAQKHFTRQADGKRKRRSSLFDLQIPVSVRCPGPATHPKVSSKLWAKKKPTGVQNWAGNWPTGC